MRIVAGSLKGRAIVAPEGQGTRPTSDRARQAVFNVLEHAVWAQPLEGARVLDLFAGSGALGFEAISRGAVFALFVETDDAARGAIRENADAWGLMGRTRVHRRSATDLGVRPGSAGEAFDLAIHDPPYGKGLGEQALASLIAGGWLNPGGIVVLEESQKADVKDVAGLTLIDTRDYGDTKIRFYRG
ncbi:16S rRNA (guanine(966)-N(2))-methyltransferase RsmD [Brevundimonas sp.]|uniref:16S rRNA (guanine(966)-N(2))-methyltransferase RsmD n=1 Tax=Brevundimonas sp. TaxID=1871086 RepID=UPI0035AD959B